MIFPWLFNVYMHGVVREFNAGMLGKGLELLCANGGSGLELGITTHFLVTHNSLGVLIHCFLMMEGFH